VPRVRQTVSVKKNELLELASKLYPKGGSQTQANTKYVIAGTPKFVRSAKKSATKSSKTRNSDLSLNRSNLDAESSLSVANKNSSKVNTMPFKKETTSTSVSVGNQKTASNNQLIKVIDDRKFSIMDIPNNNMVHLNSKILSLKISGVKRY
jgi:hypothetical protein